MTNRLGLDNKLGLFALTPGEWISVGRYVYSHIEYEDDNPDDIELAKVRTRQDAQMMAAAPYLLEALELMLDIHGWYHPELPDGQCNACQKARAAIIKAKGQAKPQ